MQSKNDIRKYILEKRESVAPQIRKELDLKIFNRLTENKLYKDAHVIFTFVSFKSEVDTHAIINHALKESKTIYVPKIRNREKGIEIFKINSFEELKTGYFGILEPIESCEEGNSDDIDLILMPGVAFDSCGGRLGYGRGYYDRFLRNMHKDVSKIALAYDFQLLDSVPMDESDVQIDGIITDEKTILANSKE